MHGSKSGAIKKEGKGHESREKNSYLSFPFCWNYLVEIFQNRMLQGNNGILIVNKWCHVRNLWNNPFLANSSAMRKSFDNLTEITSCPTQLFIVSIAHLIIGINNMSNDEMMRAHRFRFGCRQWR